MAISATRQIAIAFTGDFDGNETYAAAANAASPGQVGIVRLASGANTITVPVNGTTVKGFTIIPPAANTNVLTLKGVSGDTGIALHLTDPTSIGLGSAVTTFVINAAGQTDVRILWT